MKLRAAAANVIFKVISEGCSLSDELPRVLASFKDTRDQAFIQAVSFGVCRRYFYLNEVATSLLEKPLKAKDQDIYSLILVGLFQLTDMRVLAHAAVAETVAAADLFKKSWAKGLLNAVLRHYQRKITEINLHLSKEAYYDHPMWMIEKLKKDHPDDWKAILTANNQQPPFSLRVNEARISREHYLNRLKEHAIVAAMIPETLSGITLEHALDVSEVPGFFMGDVSVQDGAAQIAAVLLKLEQGQRVLDACAAPGGKTTHILELESKVDLIAVDRDNERLKSLKENLERLQLSAKIICTDVSDIKVWWDGQLFDRILLDAPCSASGVIRRHPDIKLLRHAEDMVKLSVIQKVLLNIMWGLLKPGGLLVYATCSVFLEENEELLAEFLQEHADAREEIITIPIGKKCIVGRQILPGMNGMDGFYYGCLRKIYHPL